MIIMDEKKYELILHENGTELPFTIVCNFIAEKEKFLCFINSPQIFHRQIQLYGSDQDNLREVVQIFLSSFFKDRKATDVLGNPFKF